jgi:hypothetical protein
MEPKKFQRRVYERGVLSLYSNFMVLQVEQERGENGSIPTKGL